MNRIKALQKEVDLAFVTDPVEIYYLTGLKLSRGSLVVHRDGATLFVDGRYLEKCSQHKEVNVESDEKLEESLKQISFQKVSLNGNRITHNQFLKIQELFPGKEIVLDDCITRMRMVKDSDEIEKMKKSAKLNWEGYHHLKEKLNVGMTEREAAWIFESYSRERGAEKMAFGPTVAFGENTSMPHHEVSDRPLAKGEPVLIDLGIHLDGYTSDLTRSFLYKGRDAAYEKLANLVKEAHHLALQLCVPGTNTAAIDEAVIQFFKENGVESDYKHSLGHSLGLEVHEFPIISKKVKSVALQEGMVITIEPGLYIDGKWGFRFEDTIQIMNKSYENYYPKGE